MSLRAMKTQTLLDKIASLDRLIRVEMQQAVNGGDEQLQGFVKHQHKDTLTNLFPQEHLFFKQIYAAIDTMGQKHVT